MSHPLLDYMARPVRQEWANRLRLGPWCWPSVSEPEARARAREISGLAGPPAAPPGVVLLATDTNGLGTLWVAGPPAALARVRRQSNAPWPEAFVGPQASAAWRLMCRELPRHLPFAFTSLRGVAEEGFVAFMLATGSHATSGTTPNSIDGPSFGLAFALSIASRILEVPVPGDVVALAEIDRGGHVARVGGLPAKCGALREVAFGVRRAFIHSDDADAVSQHASLTCTHCGRVGDALHEAWADVVERVSDRANDAATRRRMVDDLVHLVAGGRGALHRWDAPLRAVKMLRAKPVAADPDTDFKLALVEAVATRHDGPATRADFDTARLASLPEPVRTNAVAHIVQQAASGAFDPRVAGELYRRHSRTGADAFPEHLMLLGAYGRLLANLGQHVEALDCQRLAAHAWIERRRVADASYPLCEWFRLSGALENRATLDEAEALFRDYVTMGDFGPDSLPYLRMNLGRAYAMFALSDAPQPSDVDRAIEELTAVTGSVEAHDHVAGIANRWLALMHDHRGDHSHADEFTMRLKQTGDRLATWNRALDKAIAAGAALDSVWSQLHALQPNLEAALVRQHLDPSFDAAWAFRRFFPL